MSMMQLQWCALPFFHALPSTCHLPLSPLSSRRNRYREGTVDPPCAELGFNEFKPPHLHYIDWPHPVDASLLWHRNHGIFVGARGCSRAAAARCHHYAQCDAAA